MVAGDAAGLQTAREVQAQAGSVPMSTATNTPLRMHMALKMMRAWNNGTEGYSADVVMTVNKWIDGGMNGPIPYPASPFFDQWARKNGYSNVDGYVGFVLLAKTEASV